MKNTYKIGNWKRPL